MSDKTVSTNYGPVPFSDFTIFSGIHHAAPLQTQTPTGGAVAAAYSTARVGREAAAPDPISGLSAKAIHKQVGLTALM
jgi:hypothetical protein